MQDSMPVRIYSGRDNEAASAGRKLILPFLLLDAIGLRTGGVGVGVAVVGVEEPIGALAGLRRRSVEEYCLLPGGYTGARPLRLPPPVLAVPIPGADTLMPPPPPTNSPPPGDPSHVPPMF